MRPPTAAVREQLALVDDAGPAGPRRSLPAPRQPVAGELRVAPELGAPGREVDRWRISGREAPVLTPFSATACTGNAGLCGVCTGGPCQHDLDHDQHEDHDQHDHQDEDGEIEREIEDEEPEP